MLPSAAGPFTSAFFNPALAASVTFHCSGHTLLEYAQVYWLGPLTGKGEGSLGPTEELLCWLWESLRAGGKASPRQWLRAWGQGQSHKVFLEGMSMGPACR